MSFATRLLDDLRKKANEAVEPYEEEGIYDPNMHYLGVSYKFKF